MSKHKKKSKKNISSTFYKIIAIIYTLLYFLFIGSIIKLNVLPNKFLIPIIVISLVISIGINCFLWFTKIKKQIKIGVSILSILLIVIYLVSGYYLFTTINFLNNLKTDNSQTEQYYVLVHKESSIANIEEITDQQISVLSITDSNYENAKDKLLEKTKINFQVEESMKQLTNIIKNKGIIFVSSSVYSILSEKEYAINEISKIIYTVNIKTTSKDITKSVDVSKKPFNVYISGIDTTGPITNVARSDVNMIATVNPNTHQILLTSIPRDYYVTLHSYGSKDKLTHSGMYGISETVATIEDFLGIDVNYYVRVNFTSVINLVDIIGGITINSDYTFTTHGMGVKYTFKYGENNLNGSQALAFARERKSFSGGDRQRIKNQQLVLSAIIKKVTSSETILSKYSSILNTTGDSIQTNMDQNIVSKLIKKQLDQMPSWEITQNSLEGTDSHNVTYTMGNVSLYVMQPNLESVQNAINKINDTLNGTESEING